MRMVELPSGHWIAIDKIESIEDDMFSNGVSAGSVAIYMQSGRVHMVKDHDAIRVRHNIAAEYWKVMEV